MRELPTVVFLDRDGTIIRDVNYLSRPEQVELLPGAARAIRELNEAHIPVVVVTNQSGIARGYFSEQDYERARSRLDELLTEHGAHVDASYFCPHHPDIDGACDCRKPGSKLFRDAARERSLDMARPAFVGDRLRDVLPARELGGTGILLQATDAPGGDITCVDTDGFTVARSLMAAVEGLLHGPTRGARARIAVLASGGGTNLQAILDHFSALGEARSGDIVLVASNRESAPALERARTARVPAVSFSTREHDTLLALLASYEVDIVALAGYLKLVPAPVIERFRGRILNVHPGPLPNFGGPGMYGARVHQAVLAAGLDRTAVTVHLVDEQYDRGMTLATWPVAVLEHDSTEQLAARVLRAEHIIYPRVLDALAADVAREWKGSHD